MVQGLCVRVHVRKQALPVISEANRVGLGWVEWRLANRKKGRRQIIALFWEVRFYHSAQLNIVLM